MQVSITKGYEGGIEAGQRKIFVFNGTGPTSYTQQSGGGDAIALPFGLYLDYIAPIMSVSGNFFLCPFPTTVGSTRATWAFSWRNASNFGEVAATTNLSAEKVQFMALGGDF